MQSLIILGRQPALGLAELESLYGAGSVRPVGHGAALLNIDPTQLDFERLGGSTKFARVHETLPTTDWREIERFLMRTAPQNAAIIPEGKLTLGISVYGLKVSPKAIGATGLTLKKIIRKTGRPVRLVPNSELELSTAQVLHNKLTTGNGSELLLVRDGQRTLLAQTVRVQDIESYTVRDRDRPKRDARVGMLPPKLAQILINLAVGELPRENESSRIEYMGDDEEHETLQLVGDHSGVTILDPFCGTGVVLQEALLMRYDAYGTDIDQRMVDYTRANVDWLGTAFELGEFSAIVAPGDATTYTWEQPFTHVACETYLGRPFTAAPSPEILNRTISECNVIIKKFLKNISTQMQPGQRLCVAVPAWQTRSGHFKHLPLLATSEAGHLDQLRDMGYNRISFEHIRPEDLLYYRADQVVARELLVLEKK